MSAPTREKIKGLITQDPSFATFAEACVWPDHPRKRAPEQFINVPRTFTDIHTASCQGVPTCLFTAIETDSNVLKDPNASAGDQLASLKFLGHWVGDIHQPLHVSFEDDRGGNKIDAHGKCSSNPHSDWDTCIVKTHDGLDAKQIADSLRGQITDAQRTQWKASTPKCIEVALFAPPCGRRVSMITLTSGTALRSISCQKPSRSHTGKGGGLGRRAGRMAGRSEGG